MAVMLALGAALAYGSADFMGGVASRRTAPLAAALGAQIAGLVVLAVVVPLLGPATVRPADLTHGALAGLFGGLGLVLIFRALARGPMSVVAPTAAMAASAVPVLAGLIGGDRPGAGVLAGIAVSFVAVVLIMRDGRHRRTDSAEDRRARTRVLPIALAGGAIFGLFFVALHATSAAAGLWPLVAARAASVPMLAGLIVGRRRSLRAWWGPEVLPTIAVSGLLDMSANVLYLLALRHGMLVVVAALTGLYPASTIVLAQTRLGERLAPVQAVGLATAAVAAVLVAA